MNLQQLKYILEVYKQGSINKASQTLFVTQPTLSIAIKELEKEIGFVIFERSSRGINPTPAGTAFIHTVRDIFLKLENIKEQYIGENNDGSALVLRISSSRYSFVSKSIIDYYNNEVSSFDKYSIMAEEQDCNQVVQNILSRKSDVGIIHTNLHTDMMYINLFEKKDIKYVKLFDSVPYIIFRKGHPLEKEKNITNEMLLKYPQIRTSSTNINYYDNDTNFNFNEYINSDKNFFINSRSSIYNLLSKTDAIFFALTKYGVTHLQFEYTARPLNDEVSYFFYAIMLKTESRNKYVNDFINVLKKNVQ